MTVLTGSIAILTVCTELAEAQHELAALLELQEADPSERGAHGLLAVTVQQGHVEDMETLYRTLMHPEGLPDVVPDE